MRKFGVLMLYQDCFDCGADKEWYEEQVEKAKKLDLHIEPVPHTLPTAKELFIEASKKGCKKLPVLTDTKKFGYDISKFAKPAEETKTKKVKAKDGDTKKAD